MRCLCRPNPLVSGSLVSGYWVLEVNVGVGEFQSMATLPFSLDVRPPRHLTRGDSGGIILNKRGLSLDTNQSLNINLMKRLVDLSMGIY